MTCCRADRQLDDEAGTALWAVLDPDAAVVRADVFGDKGQSESHA